MTREHAVTFKNFRIDVRYMYLVNRTYACDGIVNIYIGLIMFVVLVNLCNITGQVSASSGIISGAIH